MTLNCALFLLPYSKHCFFCHIPNPLNIPVTRETQIILFLGVFGLSPYEPPRSLRGKYLSGTWVMKCLKKTLSNWTLGWFTTIFPAYSGMSNRMISRCSPIKSHYPRIVSHCIPFFHIMSYSCGKANATNDYHLGMVFLHAKIKR